MWFFVHNNEIAGSRAALRGTGKATPVERGVTLVRWCFHYAGAYTYTKLRNAGKTAIKPLIAFHKEVFNNDRIRRGETWNNPQGRNKQCKRGRARHRAKVVTIHKGATGKRHKPCFGATPVNR